MKLDYKDGQTSDRIKSVPSQSSPRAKLICLIVFLISAAFFLADIGENSIRYSDEATHVRVIQEMIGSKNYLKPTLDGELYLNKPPLKMWITICVAKLIGESNFSFRLVDGLCSAGIVAIAFLFAYEFFMSLLAGVLTSFILLGSFGFFYGGRFNTATQDSFVVFANCYALWCAYLICKRTQVRVPHVLWPMVGFGLALAAGVMAKSIVGLVPLIVLAPVFALHRQLLFKILKENKLATIVGMLCAIVPPTIYFAHVLLSFDGAWNKIFGYDIKARLFTEGFHNPEKWWFYLDRLFVQSEFCANWLLAFGLSYQVLKLAKERGFNQAFLASWAFVPLIVFTCLQSRAFHYIGPAFPAFALVITAVLMECIGVVKSKKQGSNLFLKCFAGIVLLCSSLSLGISFAKAGTRLVQAKRKLPIEVAVTDLFKLNRPLRVATLDFSRFTDGDTYQRWRQQFYLDKLERNRRNFSSIEELIIAINRSESDVIFTSWESALSIFSDKSIAPKVCAYAPIWKPDAKRQSVKPDPGQPQAMALLFTGCDKKYDFKAFLKTDRFIDLESPQVVKTYGFSNRERSGATSFWSLKKHTAFIDLAGDSVLNKVQTKLILQLANANPGVKLDLKILLNGSTLTTTPVSGGKFRNFEVDVPQGAWSANSNIISLHDVNALQNGNSDLRMAGFRIKAIF